MQGSAGRRRTFSILTAVGMTALPEPRAAPPALGEAPATQAVRAAVAQRPDPALQVARAARPRAARPARPRVARAQAVAAVARAVRPAEAPAARPGSTEVQRAAPEDRAEARRVGRADRRAPVRRSTPAREGPPELAMQQPLRTLMPEPVVRASSGIRRNPAHLSRRIQASSSGSSRISIRRSISTRTRSGRIRTVSAIKRKRASSKARSRSPTGRRRSP
jgi:hypothetical protein